MSLARYYRFSRLMLLQPACRCLTVQKCSHHHHSTSSQHLLWISHRKHRSTLNPSYFVLGTSRQIPVVHSPLKLKDQGMSGLELYLTEEVIKRFPFKTLDEVWAAFIGNLESSTGNDLHLTPKDIADTWVNLFKVKYANLMNIPWVERFIHVAHIQLKLSNTLEKEMAHLWEAPEMDLLCCETMAMYRSCTDEQLIDMCLSMVYIGMKPTDPRLHQVIYECVARIPSLEPEQLYILSVACRRMFRRSTVVAAIINRCREILNDDQRQLTVSMMAALCRSLINCKRICSIELWQMACHEVLELLEDKNIDVCVDSLADLVNFGQKTLYGAFFNKNSACRILKFIGERSAEKVDCCNASHIGMICDVLSTSPDLTKSHRNIIQTRAAELITETTKLSDIVNLLFAIQTDISPQLLRVFENKLFAHLTDADSVVLGNLARSLQFQQSWNLNIIDRFHSLAIQRIEELFQSSTLFARVIRLLSLFPRANKTLQFRLMKAIEQLIERTDMLYCDDLVLSYAALYVFPRSSHSLNSTLLVSVVRGIPRWNVTMLVQLMEALNHIPHRQGSVMSNQLTRIYHALHKRLQDGMDILHSRELYHLSQGLVKNSNYRDPILTSKLLEKFSDLTPHMTSEMQGVVQLFRSVRYHLPKVYDDCVSYVIDHPTDVRLAALVLSACAAIGYIPSRIDEFTRRLMDHVRTDFNSLARFRMLMAILVNLAQIQQFPEEELSRVFNVEFIEQVDALLAKSSFNYRQVVENRMMLLNRCVCLEFPQLGTPWFHDQYCVENLVRAENTMDARPAKKQLQNDVEACLLEVLGGERFIRRWSYSPYYHEIDFECVLDGNDRPVIMGKRASPDDVRVAVLTHTEDNFCYNSKILDGRTQMDVRHLEILQYKVVQVPHFDWYSMGLTDWQAKKDYLSQKIFSRPDITLIVHV